LAEALPSQFLHCLLDNIYGNWTFITILLVNNPFGGISAYGIRCTSPQSILWHNIPRVL
jgi:hypothetical protein